MVLLDDASFGRYIHVRLFDVTPPVIYLLQGGRKASGVTQDYASSRCNYLTPVCGPGSVHTGHRRIIQGTCRQRDVSSKGCIIQGTHRPRHSSFKDYRTGTHRSGTNWHCTNATADDIYSRDPTHRLACPDILYCIWCILHINATVNYLSKLFLRTELGLRKKQNKSRLSVFIGGRVKLSKPIRNSADKFLWEMMLLPKLIFNHVSTVSSKYTIEVRKCLRLIHILIYFMYFIIACTLYKVFELIHTHVLAI